MNPTAEACADLRAYMADGTLPTTPAMAAHDRRQAMRRDNPLLAFACWIEAAADRRIEADVTALSLLADMADRARELIERETGSAANPLYPDPAALKADALKRRFAALHDATVAALVE